jgi:HAD superfamily hydrolase (TIGR01484 family)
MSDKIKLIALDVDGVISKGMKSNFDYKILNILADINSCAYKNRETPSNNSERVLAPVTIITGRPQPYVEALLQVIQGFVPAIFEQGTGFYDPASYIIGKNPDLKNLEMFNQIKSYVSAELAEKNMAVVQPGKEYTISLYSKNKEVHNNLKEMILEKNRNWDEYFDFIYSSNCLNIMPKGFHKGKGIELLSEKTGIPLCNILGVGDSDVDVEFLEKTGFSAAPANSSEKVKKAVSYIASKNYQDGLYEILEHYLLLP